MIRRFYVTAPGAQPQFSGSAGPYTTPSPCAQQQDKKNTGKNRTS